MCVSVIESLLAMIRLMKIILRSRGNIKFLLEDPDTGLFGKGVFLFLAEDRLALFSRHRMAWSVVNIDINGLKKVNDSLGHHAGDILIGCLGESVRASIRSSDMACRMGGDEFVILIDGDASVAEVVAKRIGKKFSLLAKERENDIGNDHFSFSYGIYEASDGDGLEEAIREADSRMFQAKRSEGLGRD